MLIYLSWNNNLYKFAGDVSYMLASLVPVVVFVGFFVGALLAHVSPEEMRSGRRYFIWLTCIISLAILAGLFYFGGFSIFGFLLGILFGILIREYYFALGMAVAMSTLVSPEAFFFISALAFAFGVVYGTVIKSSGKFTFTNVATKIAFFFLPFCILFVPVPPKPFLMFAAGALLTVLLMKCIPKKDIRR